MKSLFWGFRGFGIMGFWYRELGGKGKTLILNIPKSLNHITPKSPTHKDIIFT